MWTQESQLSTVLSASRWNKSTQENKSNPCINHPAYSELYITHQHALARLVLRLCWNLSRPDSLCTFNHTGFASPFQPAACQHHLAFEKQPPSSFFFNPASFPSWGQENYTIASCAHCCPVVFYTPGQYRSKRTARYPSHGQVKEDGQLEVMSVLPPHPSSTQSKEISHILFTPLCSAPAPTVIYIRSKCSLFRWPWSLIVTVPLTGNYKELQSNSVCNSLKRRAKTMWAHQLCTAFKFIRLL